MWVVMLAARFRAAWSLTSDASEETGSIRVARRLRLSRVRAESEHGALTLLACD